MNALLEILVRGAGAIASYAAVGVILLIVGFYVIDLATPGRLSEVIRTDRNPNATLLAASAMAAIGLIVAASIWSSGGRLAEGLAGTAVFGLVGIVVQTLAMLLFDRVVGISVRDLVKEPELQPGARLLAVTHVAIGLITAVAVI
ncbi:DUF350 domain-containing protein [Nonomuraea glycinis]|jgi:uncharacterized membrane protein YjfL (UPF0719 family)|uniref:DUF350 domain-containing protein n=1 Tax=Nonomuraea glycinis TaxID=2047744 RepID=A0A918E756_9ACTN|nr:DUF350 domain-containing protein [Nonomuraea glycinis]MCA2179293.1 DUF350 domain-containing protein [Nonomuraea glycinis]WSG67628.1 DUF350 domain-containing protein [Nonomuraea glycinis]GGP09993.1 hypothetical protein GCM10012278_47870 [Nonomuraea glycinis]